MRTPLPHRSSPAHTGRRLLMAGLGLLLAGCGAAPLTPAPSPSAERAVPLIDLGAEASLCPLPGSGQVSVIQAWLPAGRGAEGAEEQGASSALARWMGRADGPRQPIERLGGTFSAWSTPEAVVMEAVVPADQWGAAVDTLLSPPVLLTAESLPGVVRPVSERSALQGPGAEARAVRQSLAAAWPGPLTRPPVDQATLESLKAKPVAAFQTRCLGRQGALVVADTPARTDEVRQRVQKALAPWPSVGCPVKGGASDPNGAPAVQVASQASGHLVSLTIPMKVDTPEAMASLAIVGQHIAQRARGAGIALTARPWVAPGAGALQLTAHLAPGDLRPVWRHLIHLIHPDRARAGLSGPRLSRAAHKASETLHLTALRPEHRARLAGRLALVFGMSNALPRLSAALSRAEIDQIKLPPVSSARAVFVRPLRAGRDPEEAAMADGLLASTLTEALAAAEAAAEAPAAKADEPGPISRGRARFLAADAPGPRLHLHAVVGPGGLSITERLSALPRLAAAGFVCPGDPREGRWRAHIEPTGLHLSAQVEPQDLGSALTRLSDCLARPGLAMHRMESTRAGLLTASSPIQAQRRMMQQLAGGSPVTDDAIRRIGRAEVDNWLGSTLRSGSVAIAVLGPKAHSHLTSALKSNDATFPAQAARRPRQAKAEPAPDPPDVDPALKGQRVVHLAVGWPAGSARQAHPWHEALLAQALADGESWLAQELARVTGGAVRLAPLYEVHGAGGLIGLTLTTTPAHEATALKLARSAVERLKTVPLTEQELSTRRQMLIGQHAVALRTPAARARHLAVGLVLGQGQTVEGLLSVDRRLLDALIPPDLQRAAQRIFVPRGMRIGRSGPPRARPQAARARERSAR